MDYLGKIIDILEIILYIALPLFIFSTFYLVLVVKKSNCELVKDAVRSPILPNFDLSFFGKLQKEYLNIRKNIVPALVNRVAFFIITIGFFLLFFLVFIQELFRY